MDLPSLTLKNGLFKWDLQKNMALDYIAKNLNGSEFNNLMTTVLASHHDDDDDF